MRDMSSYWICEKNFVEGGPFVHLCTKPLENELLFRTEEELDTALNLLAVAAFETECKILAFALMSNHMHFILEGQRPVCEAFYENYQSRLVKLHRLEGRSSVYLAATPSFIPINNLRQLRDEIVYVIRNPFVDRTRVNLFSYRWCSGYLYFNGLLDLMIEGESASELPILKRRAFKHERNADIDPRIMIHKGVVLPSCFVDYERVEQFFENARQFVHWTLKNVESQLDIAKRIGEKFFLDDNDLWNVVFRMCRETYKVEKPGELSHENKVRLANTLKREYNASNAQIARCTKFTLEVVNELFPLSSKQRP